MPRTTTVIRSLLLAVSTVVLVAGCEGGGTVGAGGGAGGSGFVTQLPSPVETQPNTDGLVGSGSASASATSSAAASSSAESSAPVTTTTTTTETTTVVPPPETTTEKPADPPPATQNPPANGAQTQEAKVLEITNKERATAGCAALKADDRLAAAARGHSEDMAAQNYFDHVSKDGRSFVDRIKATGYPSPGAENIAAGQQTPEAVMKSWMESPGHRANILNCDLKALGVGIGKGGKFGIYWTQNFGRQ